MRRRFPAARAHGRPGRRLAPRFHGDGAPPRDAPDTQFTKISKIFEYWHELLKTSICDL